ncbi:hypothetical protein CKA32_005610 [Geitlerinema sp. FC II]|nr:hypothetical protein CKA32_005610 [Geitlerinema sp. FC II]
MDSSRVRGRLKFGAIASRELRDRLHEIFNRFYAIENGRQAP